MRKLLGFLFILAAICCQANAWVWTQYTEKPPAGVLPNLSHPQMGGLIHWWLAGEGSGDMLYDQIGGLDAQFQAFDDHWDYGQWGAAAQFHATGDLADAPGFVIPASFTVSLWYYPHTDFDDDSFGTIFLSLNSGNGYTWAIYKRNDDPDPNWDNVVGLTWDRGAEDTSSFRHLFKSADNWQQNTWQHMAVTQSGTDSAIYINGIEQTWDYTFTRSILPVGDLDVKLANSFDGLMDDFRIYDYVLSQEEVMLIYQTPPPNLFNRVTPAIGEVAAGQVINVHIE
jgi:hypothetical protein